VWPEIIAERHTRQNDKTRLPSDPSAVVVANANPLESIMNTQTLLIIIIVLLVLGGGGYYGHGRWF
jgi:hypothetical protein